MDESPHAPFARHIAESAGELSPPEPGWMRSGWGDPVALGVYADWLDENKMPTLAEMVRFQSQHNLRPHVSLPARYLTNFREHKAGLPYIYAGSDAITRPNEIGVTLPSPDGHLIGLTGGLTYSPEKAHRLLVGLQGEGVAGADRLLDALRDLYPGVGFDPTPIGHRPQPPERLRRPPVKVRYAQFVGRAHPSIRGYHVEHALRRLADPDRNHPDIAGLARHALENGPGNLPILADALEEHEHPALGDYNWKAIPRGIQVDQAVRGAARSIAAYLYFNRDAAGNATGPVSPGSGPVGEAHRFGSSPVSLGNTHLGPPLARRVPPRRMSRKVRYASFPGADQPTVTVRVPVPTPAPMTKKKPQQPVLQKFGNTVAPAPPPQPAVPGVVPQEPQDQDFAPVPFAGPRTIIFPQSPPVKKRQPTRLKMSREEMQSFLDHMRENPGDGLANIGFADWLRENGHPAVGFVLQKAFENPGNRQGTRRHPITGNLIDNYHAMLPGHQGGPPVLIGMSPHREPTPEGYVIAGVGIPGLDTPHYDPTARDIDSNNGYYQTLLQRHAILSQVEARHLADLIKYEGQSPYYFEDINRRKADPHRWLTMLGVPMPKRRRRPKTFSRPTPQRV